MEDYRRFILTAAGPSAQGQVAGITGFIDWYGGYVEEFSQFDDLDSRRFFARAVFHVEADRAPEVDALSRAFGDTASRFGMAWSVHEASYRPRVMILVSRFDHCLRDLLYRYSTGELNMEVTAVVSNHPDLEPLVAGYGLPYVHLPVTPETRDAQEASLWALFERTDSELMVLARYMQILSDGFCERIMGRAINIHHSFLPGFKGAKPYQQAHDRGVKLIGATAHYVTPELDEGPIIEQSVQRVDHASRASHLAATGRDCECQALSRAVRLHLERRVFLNGSRTVVFR